ncbi:MAG: hypothetical protein EXS03_03685 [Phycisphaerales bacterium]|nr:hypothetical protein [Phycisphaerales bacterium]
MVDKAQNQSLMIVLVQHGGSFEAVMNILIDSGVTCAAVAESQSIESIMQLDMPIFAGLAAMLPKAIGSRVVIAVASDQSASTAFGRLEELPRDDRPIAIILPSIRVLGTEA